MGIFTRSSEKGQILLIVVLAAVISLTVGLSVATRTITNTRISTEESNSQKALSAAEAGLEQLASDTSIVASGESFTRNLGDANFSAKAISVSGAEIVINGGNTIIQDDGVDIWLSDYPTYASPKNLTLTLFWNDPTPTNCTAIEYVLISGTPAAPVLTRNAYDACAGARVNGFSPVQIVNRTIQGVSFNRSAVVPVITSGLIARVIPLYNNTPIGVTVNPPQVLPAQGYVIESVGTAGETSRKVRVYRGFPKLPTEYFPYSLFQP